MVSFEVPLTGVKIKTRTRLSISNLEQKSLYLVRIPWKYEANTLYDDVNIVRKWYGLLRKGQTSKNVVKELRVLAQQKMLVVASRATWEWTLLTKKQSELLLTKKTINNYTIFIALHHKLVKIKIKNSGLVWIHTFTIHNSSHDKLWESNGKNYMIDCVLAFAFVNCLPMQSFLIIFSLVFLTFWQSNLRPNHPFHPVKEHCQNFGSNLQHSFSFLTLSNGAWFLPLIIFNCKLL